MVALININFNLYEVGSLTSQQAQILPRSADSKSVHLAPRSLFIPTLPDSHSDKESYIHFLFRAGIITERHLLG